MLYTVEDLKAYLRIQHSADDGLLAALALSAVAMLEQYLHRPIATVTRTFVDDAQPAGGGRVQKLLVPTWPIGTITSVVHDDGETLDVATLEPNPILGMIRKLDGTPFRPGPWTITCAVGLELHPDYTYGVAPLLEQGVRDLVADLYLRRNPAVTQEGEGGGITQTFGHVDAQGIPLRTAALLRPLRLIEVAR